VLQRTSDIIEPILLCLFRAVISLKFYYQGWSEFTTVVLRKPGKPNYAAPKAYRPIALLCTMAKVLTAIVAEGMARILESEQLLPDNHYGGRAGRKTTDAVHILEDKVKAAWRKGKVVAILFLDVEGAFPNAVTDCLIHNLRKRRIPEHHIDFVRLLLSNRSTRLKFDDFLSELIRITNGIRQGDPLSMILYIIYNADLLEIAANAKEDSLGYVNDAMAIACAKTFKKTAKILRSFMEREDGGFQWSDDHNSRFELDKLAVMFCSPKKVPREEYPELKLRDQIIK